MKINLTIYLITPLVFGFFVKLINSSKKSLNKIFCLFILFKITAKFVVI